MKKMDALGYKGLEEFKKHYIAIFTDYQRYGKVVLDKDLDKHEIEIRRILFKSKELKDAIECLTSFWKNKYQLIIDSCKDIAKAYKILKSINANRAVIPDVEIFIWKGSGDKLFYITKNFYEKFFNHKNGYVLYNGCIYDVKIDYTHGDAIIIKNEIVIEETLKDEQ